MKCLRATRKLRAERVGAGGGSLSAKSGLGSEMVCAVWLDIRLMDSVDTIEGAGVECKANLRVSLQSDHIEAAASFSVFANAESKTTGDRMFSRCK